MYTLLTSQSLPLLLLMLQPLSSQVLPYSKFASSDELKESIRDYIDEIHSTGPTRPPTRELFELHVILLPEFGYRDSLLCTHEMPFKRVHTRHNCRNEHFLLDIDYETLQETCHSMYVPCKNGVRKCHKTKEPVEVVHCELTEGKYMPGCQYKTTFKKGYALITCQWQDDIEEIGPDFVNGILEVSP